MLDDVNCSHDVVGATDLGRRYHTEMHAKIPGDRRGLQRTGRLNSLGTKVKLACLFDQQPYARANIQKVSLFLELSDNTQDGLHLTCTGVGCIHIKLITHLHVLGDDILRVRALLKAAPLALMNGERPAIGRVRYPEEIRAYLSRDRSPSHERRVRLLSRDQRGACMPSRSTCECCPYCRSYGCGEEGQAGGPAKLRHPTSIQAGSRMCI